MKSREWLRPLFLLFLALQTLFHHSHGIGWLAMIGMSGSAADFTSPERCIGIRGLSKKQIKLCKKNAEHMLSVRMGAHMALSECQAQFLHRRWNCSLIRPISLFGSPPIQEVVDPIRESEEGGISDLELQSLSPMMRGGGRRQRFSGVDPADSVLAGLGAVHGTKEAAFVHAISSAGVAHKVTRDCSAGLLQKCGCDSSFRGDSGQGFQWAGCSDNVHYGGAFSRKFVDAQERRKRQSEDLMLMNLHNNEAGRQVIEQDMGLQCKCHGVSGSCELKTCWRAMPNFRKVGTLLKDKFDAATEVKIGRDLSGRTGRSALLPALPYIRQHTKQDLVYLHPSPTYCSAADATQGGGVVGTAGRVCNATGGAEDSCEELCCQRGYLTRTEVLEERCDCKFKWCCQVRCLTCYRKVDVSTCL